VFVSVSIPAALQKRERQIISESYLGSNNSQSRAVESDDLRFCHAPTVFLHGPPAASNLLTFKLSRYQAWPILDSDMGFYGIKGMAFNRIL